MKDGEIKQLLLRLAEASRVPPDAETVTVEHEHLDDERLELSERQEISRWIKQHGGELGKYQVPTSGTRGPGSEVVGYWRVPRDALSD